jgi:PAS domain S-box-containing protein
VSRDSLLDRLHTAVIEADADGRISWVNQGFCTMTGYGRDEVIGQRPDALLGGPLTDPEVLAEMAAQLACGEVFEGEVLNYRKDGSSYWARVRLDPLAAGGRAGYLAFQTDISAEVHARQQREELAGRLDKITQALPGVAFQFVLDAQGRGGFPWAGGDIAGLFGVAASDARKSAKQALDAVHPDDRESVRQSILESARRLTPWQVSFRVLRGRAEAQLFGHALPERYIDGATLWHGYLSDITNLKRIEAMALESSRALAESAEQTRNILDNTADGIITLDHRGLIETSNRAFARWLGMRRSSLIEQPVAQVLQLPGLVDHDPAAVQAWLRAAAGSPCEVAARSSRGELIPLELLASSVASRRGRAHVLVLRDIRERKRIEQMKSEFISTVSHELRTPLTSIRGSVGLVRSGALGKLGTDAAKLLEVAARNIERLGQLVDDLLDMDKLLSGHIRLDLVETALRPLLQESVRLTRGLEPQYGVRIELEAPRDLHVLVDPDRMHQVLANLLSNAAKFSPTGGSIFLRLRDDGDKARIEVEDQGPGIADAFRPRVFDKFAQADGGDTRKHGGSGLGLAISRELVQRMGGSIGFESSPGCGALFWCEFPRCR